MTEKNDDLIMASRRGEIGTVMKLLDAGINANIRDRYGYTPLIWAAREGHHDVVKKLIAAGIDVNGQNEWGDSALIWAVRENYPDVARELLAANADANSKNKSGDTALTLLRFDDEGHLKLLGELIGTKADVNIRNKNGATALIRAADNGYADVVGTLLEAGADAGIELRTGDTAYSLAFKKGHKRVCETLEKKRNSGRFAVMDGGNGKGRGRTLDVLVTSKVASFVLGFFVAGLGVTMIFKTEEPHRRWVGVECDKGGVADPVEKSIASVKEKDNRDKSQATQNRHKNFYRE